MLTASVQTVAGVISLLNNYGKPRPARLPQFLAVYGLAGLRDITSGWNRGTTLVDSLSSLDGILRGPPDFTFDLGRLLTPQLAGHRVSGPSRETAVAT